MRFPYEERELKKREDRTGCAHYTIQTVEMTAIESAIFRSVHCPDN